MSSQQIYQEMILHHNKYPQNYRHIDKATHSKEGFNPVCGDHLTLEMIIENDQIVDVAFLGEGCAISKASASMMTEVVKNKSVSEAMKIFESFHHLLTHQQSANSGGEDKNKLLGKLQVFSGIWQYPARVKCASLCWHTLKAILNGDKTSSIKTEE